MSALVEALRAHPRHLLAGSLGAGLATAQLGEVVAFAVAMCVLILLVSARCRADIAVAAAALLILGAACGELRLASIDADPLAGVRGEASVAATIAQVPVKGRYGVRARVRVQLADGGDQLVELRAPTIGGGSAQIGDRLVSTGTFSRVNPATAKSPEARSYAEFLIRNGVRRRLDADSARLTGRARGGPQGAVDRIRNRADRALALGLAPEPAALLRGMVLGGDNGIPEATVEAFRFSGLAHILAVSGQNVLLIVILVQAIASALAVPRGRRIALCAAVVCVYVLLCGAQASVVRAGVMGLAGLAALAASRPSSRIYALLLAGVAVLAWNPRATADVGAQLSFAAVLGIIAFTGPLAARLTRVPRWAAEAFAATAGATLATAPLMALHFETVSLVSLAANVLGEPLIGPIVWLGSLTAAIGQVSAPLASLLGAPNQFLLGALIELAKFAAAMPGAQVESPGFGPIAAAISLAGVVLLALVANGIVPVPRVRVKGVAHAYTAVTLAAVLVGIAVVFVGGRAAPVSRPAIVMLDVGQGDATLLLGASGCSALIDGGPPGDDLEQKIRATGVERLDAVLVTHPENDHHGGVLELARADDLPVGLFLDTGGNTANPDYAALRADFARNGVRAQPVSAGLDWRCGDLSIEVIAPAEQTADAPPPADPNTRAAVTRIAVGQLGMLASGDAESPQLLPLALPTEPIIKVPHHGSDDPGLAAVLARVRPQFAIIGVGAENRFGHPTPGTLGALDAVGAKTFRTDRDGRITIRPGPAGKPLVSTSGSAR